MADRKPNEVRPRRALIEEPASSSRPRRAIGLVVAVAAVVVAGLAIGYAVLGGPGTTGAADAPVAGTATPAGSPPAVPPALLTDAMLVGPAQAEQVDDSRSWRVALTQRGLDDQSPRAACLDGGADRSTGPQEPTPEQSVVRVLSSSGTRPPGLLHQADAYPSAKEASRAYAARARALGGCATPGSFLESSYRVTGLGDEAVGAVVRVATDTGSTEQRSVMLARTGRVVNVVDVAQTGATVPAVKVAQALAGVTAAQCGAAAGRCNATVGVTAGSPPPGGDQPGS